MSNYTSADLARLDTAIATGMLELELAGRKVKYRSMDELMRARDHVSNQLTRATRRGTVHRFNFTTARDE